MIDLYAYGASALLNIKDVNRLKEDLKKDFLIKKELTTVAGSLGLKFGNFLALANTALITSRHVAFATDGAAPHTPIGNQQYPPVPQQSPPVPEHSAAI